MTMNGMTAAPNATDNGPRSYGNWTKPRTAGLLGLSAIGTAILFGGAVFGFFQRRLPLAPPGQAAEEEDRGCRDPPCDRGARLLRDERGEGRLQDGKAVGTAEPEDRPAKAVDPGGSFAPDAR